MKRILITGKDSYIGTYFERYVLSHYDEFIIDTISVIGDEWRRSSFSGYDAVFHVAGLAHSTPRASEEALYYRVNTDLAIDVAVKAKNDGAAQFVFMSSIIVYGHVPNGIITKDTAEMPRNFYGNSKLLAESGIIPLASDNFTVTVLRPPMIYGKNSKGNYRKLAKLAKFAPVFPKTNNKRSILFIDNLCEFIISAVNMKKGGVLFPQNEKAVSTDEMVSEIAKVHGKNVLIFPFFMPRALLTSEFAVKLFGSLEYDKSIYDSQISYKQVDFENSITLTES